MTIILRSQKGSPLTNNEVDGNFIDLDGRVSAAKSSADAARDRATHTGTQLASTISNFASAALSVVLTGLSVATGTAVIATDSILIAIGKLQAQLNTLVKVSSASDIIQGRLVTTGWMGLGVPILMQPTDNADNLPFVTARFLFGSGGLNLPYNFVYLDQFCYGSGSWTRQVAYAVNGPGIWERFFPAGAAAGAAWTPIVVGDKVASAADATPGRLLTVGYGGLGSKDNNPYLGNNLNPTDYRTGGSFFGQWLIDDLGLVVGVLTVYAASDSQWLGQVIINLNSGALFTRSQNGVTGGVFTPWRRTYNDSNSFNDPQTGGGLMSATVVSGWTIEKFANGTCIVAGAFTSASLAANSQTSIDTAIPSVLVGETVAGVTAAALPTASIDVGAVNAFMVGNTIVRIYARNGTTAQAILFRIKITGRWKA